MTPDLPPIYLSPAQEHEAAELVARIRAMLPVDDYLAAFTAIGEMVADGEITDGSELLEALAAVLESDE